MSYPAVRAPRALCTSPRSVSWPLSQPLPALTPPTRRPQVEIVDDGTPLMLLGPKGKLVSGVGLSVDIGTNYPYGPDAVGPKMVAAKMSKMDATGEGTAQFPGSAVYLNDCLTLYNTTQYRLRIYTSGGFSPDGVASLYPTDYTKYFRIHLTLPNGEIMMLEEDKVEYEVPGAGTIYIQGLADVGPLADVYDGCYNEDHDNYIDFCMVGDERAMRLVTGVEMPVGNATADPLDQYKGLYNPGGPGNNPTPGVNYTVPSTYQLQSVWTTIDDPWTTSYPYPYVAPAPGPAPAPVSPSVMPSPVPTPSSGTTRPTGLAAVAGALLGVGAAWAF